jgi:hypothetical protein
MSEEQTQETQETNDGTWSGLKKTIIGTLTTVIAGGGVWVSTLIFGGSDESDEGVKTEQSAPASQPVINLNVQQNQENKQKTENNNGGGVIRERIIEKPAAQQPTQPQPKKEEESW